MPHKNLGQYEQFDVGIVKVEILLFLFYPNGFILYDFLQNSWLILHIFSFIMNWWITQIMVEYGTYFYLSIANYDENQS
ncbi:Uncharacterised protein [Actinobacillus equuli]|nr:Uncharacterised protein [Actinobacillus equuli]